MLDLNIQEIMEMEGATELEARALYHLQEAFRAFLEINAQDVEADPGGTFPRQLPHCPKL
jgi:hypothetical protein